MKNIKQIASVLLVLACGLVSAGDWEDGYSAYERQDYKTAVKLWRKVADTGDSSAQSIMGAMYAQGQGVPQDYLESIKWYRLAAAQGEPKAQSKLDSCTPTLREQSVTLFVPTSGVRLPLWQGKKKPLKFAMLQRKACL